MAKKRTAAQREAAKAQARQRYADDPEYRERKLAETNAYYALHCDELNAKQRERYATDSEFREQKLARGRTGKRKATLEEETRERLAISAVADEAEAGGRRDFACNAAHVAAPAPKREVQRSACHVSASDHESAPKGRSGRGRPMT